MYNFFLDSALREAKQDNNYVTINDYYQCVVKLYSYLQTSTVLNYSKN